jgi:hypothetical protein
LINWKNNFGNRLFFSTKLFLLIDNRESENERQSLLKTNNQLTKDIEKLLEYQEVNILKEYSGKTIGFISSH